LSSSVSRDVNKDLTFKAKAKDLAFKAKAKDLAFKAKAKAKDLAFKAKDKARTFRCNPVELHWLFDTTSMAH